MTFALPAFLLGLLPWAALVAFLVRGGGQRVVVPFLSLWPRPVVANNRARFRSPPLWMLLLYAASLLAILASAGPVWTLDAHAPAEVSIIIDRGITMSGEPRYCSLIDRCDRLLGLNTAGITVTLVPVPGQSVVVTNGSWQTAARSFPPTAVDTAPSLQSAVADRLRESTGPILVLTDLPIDHRNPRVILIVPDRPLRNSGITRLAARELPHPQVMVQLNTNLPGSTVQLRVQSGPDSVKRDVKFSGGSSTVFVDLPKLAESVSAQITSDDDIPADDAAWLVRQPTGITLDVAGGVPAEVRRIAAVYSRNRPAGPHVLLSDLPIPADLPGVQIFDGAGASEPLTALTTASDSLTAGVTAWPGRAIDADPPGGFRTLVRRNDHALVAVSESSPRQVWVNLDLREWSRTTDFVVFFGNVFESFRGGSGDQFVSSSPVSLGREWKRVDDGPAPSGVCPGLWPGLYRSDDGRLLAINAPVGAPAAVGKPAGDVPRPDPSRAIHGGVSLTPVVCWMALSAIVAAVFLLPRRNEPSTK